MARVKSPNLSKTLSAAEQARLRQTRIGTLIDLSRLGLPFNLDAWDGFPAARDRLFASAKSAGANLVTLTGDTHTGWANRLTDKDGEARGVEFGCTSVTSPGLGRFFPGVTGLGEMFADANEDVVWHDPVGGGYALLDITADAITAQFFKISDVSQPRYVSQLIATARTERSSTGQIKMS